MNTKLIDALRARYKAEKAEGEATLEVYLTNAAGIGEHPQIVDEMSKQVEKIATAEDNLSVLHDLTESWTTDGS